MKEKNIEVLVVSESCWTGHEVTKIGSHTILHSGTSLTHVHGVVNPPNGTSEARAPSGAFYEQLHLTLASAPSRDMTLILGDFNACVGSRASQWRSVIGPYGSDEVNENGERLLDFCAYDRVQSLVPA